MSIGINMDWNILYIILHTKFVVVVKITIIIIMMNIYKIMCIPYISRTFIILPSRVEMYLKLFFTHLFGIYQNAHFLVFVSPFQIELLLLYMLYVSLNWMFAVFLGCLLFFCYRYFICTGAKCLPVSFCFCCRNIVLSLVLDVCLYSSSVILISRILIKLISCLDSILILGALLKWEKCWIGKLCQLSVENPHRLLVQCNPLICLVLDCLFADYRTVLSQSAYIFM